jgi:uncharacterized protein (DUF58 family)
VTGEVPSPRSGGPPTSETTVPDWARSAGMVAGTIAAVLLAGAGLLLSRIDLALLAVPLVAAIAWSAERRPDPAAAATATVDVGEPEGSELAFTLAIAAPAGVESVALRTALLGGRPSAIVVSERHARQLTGTVGLLHSGPQELARVEYRLFGADAGVVSAPSQPLVASRVIAPPRVALERLPLPRRLQARVGAHESVRAGDGGDFRDVHPFAPGDRLRRIDWKATARHARAPADLFVRRTDALADATVVIVLDSRDDVGEQVAEWSRNAADAKGISALDLAREAASSIAAAYIQAGDRVGLQDLSSRRRLITHSGGYRHLARLLRAIEITGPSTVPFDHQRPPIMPSGALVYVLSSLLDDKAPRLALSWRRNGHRVIAVDVLPPARFDRSTRYERLAHRIVMMERADRIRGLQAGGVELLRWPQDDAWLPRVAQLRQLSRPVRAGRPGAGR